MAEPVSYRRFRNTDPPLIVDVWRQQPAFQGFYQDLTHKQLDDHVLSKLFFSRNGLILAVEDKSGDEGKPLGFVHASFSVTEDLSDLNYQVGLISQLRVVPGERQQEIAAGLLKQAMDYLRSRGAKVCHFGSQFPDAPFYIGLYGSSRHPGVMEKDELVIDALTANGFSQTGRVVCLSRRLEGFRPIVDRQQQMVRRNYLINKILDPLPRSWWESCTLGTTERQRQRFLVKRKRDNFVCGSVSYWDMQPIATQTSGDTRGLYDLHIAPEIQRNGVATWLVGESLKHLIEAGVQSVDAQAEETNAASVKLFQKLGFETSGHGWIMQRDL